MEASESISNTGLPESLCKKLDITGISVILDMTPRNYQKVMHQIVLFVS